MKRIMMIALFAGLLSFTGCASHQLAGGKSSCKSNQCQNSCNECNSCNNGGGGLLGKLKSGGGACQNCQGGVAVGCRPRPLRWQQGGLDYSEGLSTGLLGHGAGQAVNSMPVNPGPPTGTVGYPYYTTRGPRDFLIDNPPSIGR